MKAQILRPSLHGSAGSQSSIAGPMGSARRPQPFLLRCADSVTQANASCHHQPCFFHEP